MEYTVVIEKGPNSYGAYPPDLPGCGAAADTREEVLELINEAIEGHIACLREYGDPVPPPVTPGGVIDAPVVEYAY